MDQVRFYRKLGFFGQLRMLPEAGAVEKLQTLIVQSGVDLDLSAPAVELTVLRLDMIRVWTEDPNMVLEPGQRAYIKILGQLSDISRGCFQASEVREDWESGEGPVLIQAKLETGPFASRAIKDGNLVDLEVIKDINHVLTHPYYRFEVAEGDDMAASVLVLTAEEKATIHRNRNLHFHLTELAGVFECCGMFVSGPGKQGRLAFVGTLKDEYERALGRLTLNIEDTRVMGRYQVHVEEIQQEFNLTGYYDPAQQTMSGTLLGISHRDGAGESFLGTWKGGVSRGNQAVYGSWAGYYSSDARSQQAHRTYQGTFGGLEESIVRVGTSEPYLRKLSQWLRQVWDARQVADSPLTLV